MNMFTYNVAIYTTLATQSSGWTSGAMFSLGQ